jgi:hypothetical protein
MSDSTKAELKSELEKLAGKFNVPSITVWQQGRFIDSPRYQHHPQEWKDSADRHERMLIRPYGGTNNALFMVRNNEDEANIAEYIAAVGALLERLTDDE